MCARWLYRRFSIVIINHFYCSFSDKCCCQRVRTKGTKHPWYKKLLYLFHFHFINFFFIWYFSQLFIQLLILFSSFFSCFLCLWHRLVASLLPSIYLFISFFYLFIYLFIYLLIYLLTYVFDSCLFFMFAVVATSEIQCRIWRSRARCCDVTHRGAVRAQWIWRTSRHFNGLSNHHFLFLLISFISFHLSFIIFLLLYFILLRPSRVFQAISLKSRD